MNKSTIVNKIKYKKIKKMDYEIIGWKKIKVPKYITDCKKIRTATNRGKDWLVKLEKKYGIYENFGDAVSRAIRDKFIDSSSYSYKMNVRRASLDIFDEWRYNYNIK